VNNEKGVLAKGMLFFPTNLKHLNFYEFFIQKNHVVDKIKMHKLKNNILTKEIYYFTL
jgi:hypothetical protein